MKIPEKLEAMVADLISDEKAKREEVEGVLSQIHELTEAYFDPSQSFEKTDAAQALAGDFMRPEQPAPEPSLDAQLQNQIAFNLRRGDDQFTAERKARMALGID